MSVLIDRYVLNLENSPKVLIYDKMLERVICSVNSPKVLIYDKMLERVICSVNTLDRDVNIVLAGIILDELNTGKYEEEDSS